MQKKPVRTLWFDRIETRLTNWRILGIMAVLAVLYTLPLVFSLGSEIPGSFRNYYGDIFYAIWYLWATKCQMFDLWTSPFRFDMLAGPYSVFMFSVLAAHKFPVLMAPVTAIAGPVVSLNLFTLLNYTLAGFFSYILLFELTGKKTASLFGSLVFAFCPYAYAHAIVHMDLAAIWPLPLVFWALLRVDKKRDLPSAALLTVGLLFFHAYCSIYYYLFIPLAAGAYLFVRFVDSFIYDFNAGSKVKGAFARVSSTQWAVVTIVSVIVLAGGWLLYKFYLGPMAALEVRPIHWQERFKLSWANYLLPGVDHPWFGHWSSSVVPVRRNVTESTAYIGWVPLLLALWGLRVARRDWRAWMFLAFGLVSLSFTLGPYLGAIPMPSLLLHKVAPFIRVISRYTVFFQLALAALAAYGVAEIMRKKGGLAAWLVPLAVVLLSIEYLHPADMTPVATDPHSAPAVYAHLAALEGDITVFEYPAVAVTGNALGDYLYFQTIHKKRLFNRQNNTTSIPAEYLPFWLDLDYPGALSDPNNVALLRYFGTDYVVFHDRQRTETQTLPTLDPSRVQGLELQGEFGKTSCYRVVAEPATVLLSFDTRPLYNYLEIKQEVGDYDFDPPLVFGQGENRLGWRLMREQGRLRVKNLLESAQKVRISAIAVSFTKSRSITVELNDPRESAWRLSVGTRPEETILGEFELPAGGEYELVFRSPEGVSEVPVQGGTMKASIALAGLKVRSVE